MLRINSNGSHFAGGGPSPLECLEEVLKTEPLDRSFEAFGNFVFTPTLEHDHVVRFWGNFFTVSHVFSIDTDDPAVIGHLTTLIRSNQGRADYLSQHNPYGSAERAS
jgi:hypothetical protein